MSGFRVPRVTHTHAHTPPRLLGSEEKRGLEGAKERERGTANLLRQTEGQRELQLCWQSISSPAACDTRFGLLAQRRLLRKPIEQFSY